MLSCTSAYVTLVKLLNLKYPPNEKKKKNLNNYILFIFYYMSSVENTMTQFF